MELNDVQSKVYALLTEKRTEAVVAPEAFFIDALTPPSAPAQANTATRPKSKKKPTPKSKPGFSSFNPLQMRQAIELAARFMEIADKTGGDAGLQAALAEANTVKTSENLDLVKFALMIFITHHPQGNRLAIPPIEVRSPEKVLPSTSVSMATVQSLNSTEVVAEQIGPGPILQDPEVQLAWYREEPKANEHHEHWHTVYPHAGVMTSTQSTATLKDRQDELFLYMHEQMLARYDTERIAVGLPRVLPLSDYTVPIPEAYDPGPNLSDASGNTYFPRPTGLKMADIPSMNVTVQGMALRRDHILSAIQSGNFSQNGTKVKITADLLGATLEASIGSASAPANGTEPRPSAFYGNVHNYGHELLAFITDPINRSQTGVMSDVATAIRDPVFYRWHKHIDDFSFKWQEKQPPNNFSDAPAVLIRKGLNNTTPENQSPDIILAFKDNGQGTDPVIPGSSDPNFDGQAYGEQNFGGTNWNTDFSSSAVTTNELHTRMLQRTISWGPNNQNTSPINYLDQDKEFFYFIRVQNQLAQDQDVTVRIFLVAQAVADDRRMWIEMDKFKYTLPASKQEVIFRKAELSSVIKKPITRPPGSYEPPDTSGDTTQNANAEVNYCDCGWPYNLLLPRGTTQGMGFRLLVMFTDAQQDLVPDDTTCGSMSYCGAKNKYPDSRVMGYPFDKPFTANSIAQTIAAQNNIATRDFTIKWLL